MAILILSIHLRAESCVKGMIGEGLADTARKGLPLKAPRRATVGRFRDSLEGSSAMELLKQTFHEWQEDQVPLLAAALAYYTVFSLAPLLIIVIAVLTFFGQGEAQSTLIDQIQGILGDNVAQLIRTMIENREAGGGNLLATSVGGLLLLAGATSVLAQLQNALNIIWGVQPDPQASNIGQLIRVRLLSLGMILVIGFLLLVSLVLTTVVEGLAASAGDLLPGGDLLWALLNWLVSLAVITLLFALIFRVLPDASVPWATVWVGALVTALLFVGGKWILALYLARGAVANAYGAAGSLVVLLIWVFYSAQILLMGGEFTQVYARRRGHRIQPAKHAVRRGGH